MPGGQLFLPSQIAGIILWLRSDMGITLNGSTVSQWNDQSGTGDSNKNQVQAVPGSQPTYNTTDAAYNGRPSLSFDQVDDNFLGAGNWAVAIPATATWFIVGDAADTASCWFFQDTLSNYQAWKAQNGASHDVNWHQGVTLTATFSGGVNIKHIFVLEGNGASSKIYRDSLTAGGTGNSGTNTGTNLGVVGAGGKLGGKIVEVIGYSGVLSVANRTAVTNYLSTRYAITLV